MAESTARAYRDVLAIPDARALIGEPDGIIMNDGMIEDMYDYLDVLAAFPQAVTPGA